MGFFVKLSDAKMMIEPGTNQHMICRR